MRNLKLEKARGRLSEKQLTTLFESKSRTNIWEGSVRSGKTHVSMLRWIKYILFEAPPGDLLMTGHTYGTLRRNIINPMQNFIGYDFRFFSSMNIARLWDRSIYCYGANSLDAIGKIQGGTFAGAYDDEIALQPIEYFKMVLSRMSVEGAKRFGTTNPDAPNHPLKKEFIDRAGDLDLESFHFTLEDNDFLPPDYVRELKKEYTGLWFKRYILGLWAVAEGAIYDFFEEEPPYLIKVPPPAEYYVVGIDYGTQNPFCAILFGVNPKTKPKIWAEKEYWYCGRDEKRQKTDSEYSEDLRSWLGGTKGIKPRRIYVGPDAQSFIVQLRRDKFFGVREADNTVLDGIRTQARMLRSGEYAIVGKHCPHTVEEYSAYVWDDKAQMRGEDKPKKENDHTKEAERYPLQTMYGQEQLDYYSLTRL